jgi:DNA-directed RNA polymerase
MINTKRQGSSTDEKQLEDMAFVAGHTRYLNRNEKMTQWSLKTNNHNMIGQALPKVSDFLAQMLAEESDESRKGRRMEWLQNLQAVDDVDLLAWLGLSTCMDAVGSESSYTWTVVKIGRRVEMEIWAKQLREHDRKLANRIETKVKRDHSSERYRLKSAMSIARSAGFQQEPWTDVERAKVGQPLLNAVLAASDIFEVWDMVVKQRTVRRIGLLEAASDLLAELAYDESWTQPVFSPMVVPPRPWQTFSTGCYHDDALAAQVDLIRFASPWQRETCVESCDILNPPEFLKAVNYIQETPYKINRDLLEAVEHFWVNGIKIGKFPTQTKLERPDRPDHWESLEDTERKGWRISARDIIAKNREIDGHRAVMAQDMRTAKEMATYDKFYLPSNFDFRGRVYPIPNFSPHRDDHIKSLFLLANVRPITHKGAYWLKIHLANVGDFEKVSKRSFDDRVQWVEDNHDTLMTIASDWKANIDLWSGADKPFQFLAAVLEYARYIETGPGYMCGLPTALDGTNSGVQHFSALGLNVADAELVNLVPGPKPMDIYQRVADQVIKNIKSEGESEEANQWLDFGIDRSVVKRNVMTYGYSSKQFGFQEQLIEDLMNPISDKLLKGDLTVHPFGEDRGHKAASFLARHNWNAVTTVISSAADGMRFFQQLADSAAQEGYHMTWFTPVGFPAGQYYPKREIKKIKVYLHDREASVQRRTQITLRNNKRGTVDVRKSKAAISPNVIHSLDSAHLIKTVTKCFSEKRIKDFMLIHDSFATTPAQLQGMYEAIREAFVEMYLDKDLYQNLLTQVMSKLSETATAPEMPERGNLDVSLVLQSKYCFS